MLPSRREFLALGAAAPAGLLPVPPGFDLQPARDAAGRLKTSRSTEVRSTCPYCSVSCGLILHTLGDRAKNVHATVTYVEGDPDHPINRGSLCPKGAALKEDIVNPRRLVRPRYRAPGAASWTELSWDEAIDRIARRIKKTRDATFRVANAQGRRVNRTEGLAVIGGCTDTNEFNYLLVKAARSLGVTYLENQARI